MTAGTIFAVAKLPPKRLIPGKQGFSGVLLSTDVFLPGKQQSGQTIQPLMACQQPRASAGKQV